MSIVIIPCWRRPEFLAATLHCIERARGADAQSYLFSIDRGFDPQILDVINAFALPRRAVMRGEHQHEGPAYNILAALRSVLDDLNADDFVGLIEDDILVAEDIFEFWRDALALSPTAACTSACKNQNTALRELPRFSEPETRVYAETSYQPLAVAFRRELVEEACLHATVDYFADPIAYCASELPDHGLEPWEASQDGIFHRVVRRRGHKTLYPIVPRAFHAGWTGYNRRGAPLVGDWRKISKQILTMSSDQMNARADPRFRGIERCDLIRPRATLKLV